MGGNAHDETSPLLSNGSLPTHNNPSSSSSAEMPGLPSPKRGVVVYDVVCQLADMGCPPYFRFAPWRLVAKDFVFSLRNVLLIPFIFLPLHVRTEPQNGGIRWSGVVAQVVMFLISIVLTVGLCVSFVTGFPPPLLVIAATIVFAVTASRLQGAELRKSVGFPPPKGHWNEEWLCVNGIATTGSGAQLIANRLHELFGRSVTAVLNRSLGIHFDIIECILQRDLLLTTTDIRVGYQAVRRAVMDPTKKRVVIIGHSQGGIIVSAWADQLIMDFPDDVLAKVELYTFASAANHFSRPSPLGLHSCRTTSPFKHVEHFANDGDFVAQFGVLSKAPSPAAATLIPGDAGVNANGVIPTLQGTFGGRIFRRMKHTGHLLLPHYLAQGDCIMDDEAVLKHSQLATYLNSGNVAM